MGKERVDVRLAVVENGMVPVYEASSGEKVVYGSELHKVLGAPSAYREWAKRRLKDVDAVENEDYEPVEFSTPSGQTRKEHIIGLDIAKEMAMLERNEKGKQVRRYFIQLEKKYKAEQGAVSNQMVQFAKRQSEMNEAILDRLEKLEQRDMAHGTANLYMHNRDVLESRMKVLNELVDQVALLHCMDRNRILHFMYKALQEHFGISLNPYLSVMKAESGDGSLCNLHVIASNDRFYEAAVDMNQFAIDRKRVYG